MKVFLILGGNRIPSIEKHIGNVLEITGSNSAAARSRLAAAWRRSFEKHGLDPAQTKKLDRLEHAAIGHRKDTLDSFLCVASPKLDQLFSLVGNSGCGVLLTDADGIVLDQRCKDGDVDVFQKWGLWAGADWSEAAEGTNGIGTCLTEECQVIIHREEHYFARNVGMSCMDAPIYGAEGEVIAALDVSSARSDQTETFNRLIAAMVAQTARQIETDNFRASFPKARIIIAGGDDSEAAILLAVNQDDILIGATHGARKVFGLTGQGPLAECPASDLFGRDEGPTGFEKAERAAVIRALFRASGNVTEAAKALGVGRATLYRRMKRLGIGENHG